MKTVEEYFQEYYKKLDRKSDDEMVKIFNFRVHANTAGIVQGFLRAIREQFKDRGIDFTVADGNNGFTLMYVTVLKGKKLFLINQIKKSEVVDLFNIYFEEIHRDKIYFNPKIISYNNDEIHFRLDNFDGTLVIDTNDIIKKVIEHEYFKSS